MDYIRISFSKITTLSASMIIIILGTSVYFSGVTNSFMGDDINQIVENIPVHSISNIRLFFEGGTFYTGNGLAPLSGTYYRPVMTTAFSLLYTAFGAQPLYFHLLQLCLHILSTLLLFLVFRYFFKPTTSLLLALIFLVHPINSQAVFSIPALQEPLFFVFGILAFWTVVRFQDKFPWHLILTGLCLLLSVFTKETGILFVIVVVLYALMSYPRRALPTLGMATLVAASYAWARFNAVGILPNPHIAPIDDLGLLDRILNIPAMILLYFSKVVYPVDLAHGYYWAHQGVSLRHFLLPLFVILLVIGGIVYFGMYLKRKSRSRDVVLLVFFSLWLAIGLLPHLQIIPLDFTASETWFYFPIVGLLGIVGVVTDSLGPGPAKKVAIPIVFCLIGLLGLRSAVRGFDWSDSYTLASRDMLVSREDFRSENDIAFHLAQEGKFTEAKAHIVRSIDIYPQCENHITLGLVSIGLGEFDAAKAAYMKALTFRQDRVAYENLGALALRHGDVSTNRETIKTGLARYPLDGKLWFYLAILEHQNNNAIEAKAAIIQAHKYLTGDQIEFAYTKIMNNEDFSVEMGSRPE